MAVTKKIQISKLVALGSEKTERVLFTNSTPKYLKVIESQTK